MTSDRLSHLSQRMAIVIFCLIIAMLLINTVYWLYPTLYSTKGSYGPKFILTNSLITHLNLESLSLSQKFGGIILSSIPLLALIIGLYHLRSLFQSYGRKEYFSATAATHLGKVGGFLGLWVMLHLICEPLLSIWLTMHAPVGHRIISLSFGSPDIAALFLAACIIIIGHILRQASELNSENQQFV